MKHLLVSLPYGMAVRNLACCGVLEACQRRGAEMTVLVPQLDAADEQAVRRELPERVGMGPLLSVSHSWFYTYLKFLKQYFYSRRTGLESFQIRYRYRRSKTPLFHTAARIVELASGAVLSERQVDRLLATVRHPHEDHYRRLIRDVGADALVITKPGYMPSELPLIKAARLAGLPVVSVDTTWDNMVAKRPPYLLPDALTVWNEGMRQEALRYYGFGSDRAVVSGGPQFDVFFDEPGRFPDREAFLVSLGLDPDRQLIVFTLNNPAVMTPDNGGYIRLLLKMIRDREVRNGPNVVVRVHPWDMSSDYGDDVARFDRVCVQRPFGPAAPGSVFECIPSKSEVTTYGALMRYADVLINIASTTSLDALATDAPIVNIAFDVSETAVEASCGRFYGYSHYVQIVDSAAVRLAHSEGELREILNTYLQDRSVDREARMAARDRFLTFADAGSADRVGAAIMRMAT